MYDVIVIGGGPSGMMASIMAATNNKKVLLLEKNNKLGKKMLITGGGRCNVTNMKKLSNFYKELPVNHHFLKYSLNVFGPKQIYDYFTSLGVQLKVEDNDRVFPVGDDSSLIVNALISELERNGVSVKYNTIVNTINKSSDGYTVDADESSFMTKNVIIATGSKSFPKTGSSGDGYNFAHKLNQPMTSLYPSQSPMRLKKPFPLSGITIDDVEIKLNGISKRGSLLFTHNGISGPSAYKISEYVYQEFQEKSNVFISINFLPNMNYDKLISLLNSYNPKKEIKSFVRELLPARLADYLISISGINEINKIAVISNKDKNKLVSNILNLEVEVVNHFSIETSVVTGGGIDVKYINKETMESTISPGLYFTGELLDLHGSTGGYNITIALSTGYIAGVSIDNNLQ
ncbi:MAG: NAD(P)/FAD-dependent oxidoreductase [Bacilli bacterium]|nr:NAD(P)/FAD-dependent oxidoreductase [Bacilli bacterium]